MRRAEVTCRIFTVRHTDVELSDPVLVVDIGCQEQVCNFLLVLGLVDSAVTGEADIHSVRESAVRGPTTSVVSPSGGEHRGFVDDLGQRVEQTLQIVSIGA